jgi:ParB family transcriptional regulator, chromosome partitioning protein
MSQRMAPVFRHVPLTEIALDDHTFIITYRPEMQALQRSVAHVGVLTPLHLRQPSEQARLQVVCGLKRLLACQQTGHSSVPALVYRAIELSEQQALLLALYDNLGCRALNAVEKGRILLRLQHFGYPPDTLRQEFCALLDLPPRTETLEAYGRLATLEDSLQAAVVEGSLPLETALWIGMYTAEDREALLEVFTGLKVGSNRAREFVTYIDEICQRDACTPAGLLQALGVPALLAEAQLSGPQKLESIRRVLRQARYPRLSTYEQRFQEAVRRLRLPPQISLRPPPYFEGQQYQVTLSFSQRQELQQYAQRLLDAAQHEALDTLLELL